MQGFTVTVNDVAPSVPTDTDGAAGGSVQEGAANGTTVGIDADSTDVNSGTVTYSLFDNAGGRFAIDGTTGVVTVANAALLNFETATSHNITVRASDPSGMFNDQTFAVAVTDAAPSVPTDTDGAAGGSVQEGAANGTTVGIDANSTDVNSGTVTYSLFDNAGGRFAIDGTTGVVTVANAALLNFETATSHNITVRASDPSGMFNDQTFAVAVTDAAPSVPTDTDGAAGGSVQEGAANGTTVGIDADSTDVNSGTVTYSLFDNAGGRFAIDGTTGVVTVANAALLNFETATSHNITVRASDPSGMFNDQTFAVAVTDAAPSVPTDTDGAAGGSVQEGAANGTTVGIDADSTDVNSGTVTYSLFDNAGGRFAIDGTTGVVTVANAALLNFETATSHNITVRASDPSGMFNDQTFAIAVTDAAPSVPTDTDGAAGGSVQEGAANGTTVGIDADSTDVNSGTVTYSLFDNAGGRFAIDGTTGVVTVANAALLNFETATSHNITVRASDPSGMFNDQIFAVAVTDVAPVATADSYAGANSVDEDQTLNIAAAAGVLANDSDVNGGPFTAVLDVGPANAASFTLNPDGSFSYTPNANFNGTDSFTYHAFDGALPSSTVTASITVNAVNDVPQLTGFGDIVAFTENGAAVILDANNNAAVSDVELNSSGSNFAGATLTLARNGGANSDDTFAGTGSLDLVDSNGLGENVSLDGGGTFIGTFSQPGDGTFSITFNANATAANINSVIRQIVYANAGDNPPATLQIDATLSDGNGQPGGQAQGSGAAPGTATGSFTVNITQIDDAPFLLNVAVAASYRWAVAGWWCRRRSSAGDPDAVPPSPLTGLANATIKIETGFFAGDQLFVNLPTSGGFFIVDDGGGPVVTNISVLSNVAGTMILSGQDTTGHYQSVLDAVNYRSTAVDPSNGGANPKRTITLAGE